MKTNRFCLMLCILLTLQLNVFSHDLHYDRPVFQEWHFSNGAPSIKASFFIYRDGMVYLEDEKGDIRHFPLQQFSKHDRALIEKKVAHIEELNHFHAATPPTTVSGPTTPPPAAPRLITLKTAAYVLAGLLTLLAVFYIVRGKRKRGWSMLVAAALLTTYGFTQQQLHTVQTVTNPYWMDSAFAPFKPTINTFWDTTYFHVESKGIPTTHSMMTGITKWQQQVPIPQCYIGNNSWSIPLNPSLAPTPVPVSPQHFLRGAIAMAVNGVPIFNPYTNTGVDALLDGQLDNWGGHSGRADDYHYHIAPLHLYGTIQNTQPCAFGLDGYAVYGAYEPDGSAMLPLDTNNGHFGTNGVYHYHGVSAAPYMIHNMVGRVTEDTTLQIVPQARAYPVRPSLTPLNGAAITGFHSNATNNGYTLIYTLSGQTDSIEYNWTNNGRYTYNFYTAGTGVPTTQNYNGFSQCNVPLGVNDAVSVSSHIAVYPNPAQESFHIVVSENTLRSSIESVMVYDVQGQIVFTASELPESIATVSWKKGIYFVVLHRANENIVKRIIVD